MSPGSARSPSQTSANVIRRDVRIPPLGLEGILALPPDVCSLVIFVHGSGSSRLSPRNTLVADSLNARGIGTLLFDLLTAAEDNDRAKVFDISLLARRLIDVLRWVDGEPALRSLPLGLFGASTGAAAALVAASRLGDRIKAIVSRGGRPDLADAALPDVRAPVLLLVGGSDRTVIALNEDAATRLKCPKLLHIVPGATHLFEEPGTLERVTMLAGDWFQEYLGPTRGANA